MKFTISSSAARDENLALSRRIAELLIGLGGKVWIPKEDDSYYEGLPIVSAPSDDCFAGAHFAISVGGDGTFIRTAQLSAPKGVPVLGVNKGTVGFLTELEEGELPLLERLFHEDYKLEQRMMLEYQLRRAGTCVSYGLVLNDVTLLRGVEPQLLQMDIHQSGQGRRDDLFITRWRGDGLIVSTPTGSTAYALSCGGPLIDPRTECIELVPISNHSLTSRPTLFGSDAELFITPMLEGERRVHFYQDGQPVFQMEQGDSLMVRRSKTRTVVVRMKPESFYHTMRQKLRDY